MDWKSLVGLVAPYAPTLGTLLGGVVGGPAGAAIGAGAGRALAAAFGVPATPEAVKAAIEQRSDAVEKLRILEATRGEELRQEALVEIERLKSQAEQSKSINETMRGEIGKVEWWSWRHQIGYVVEFFGIIFAIGTAKILFLGGDIAQLAALITAITPIFLALCALNGYVAGDTTKLKTAAMTGEQPGTVLDTLRTVLVKK